MLRILFPGEKFLEANKKFKGIIKVCALLHVKKRFQSWKWQKLMQNESFQDSISNN